MKSFFTCSDKIRNAGTSVQSTQSVYAQEGLIYLISLLKYIKIPLFSLVNRDYFPVFLRMVVLVIVCDVRTLDIFWPLLIHKNEILSNF